MQFITFRTLNFLKKNNLLATSFPKNLLNLQNLVNKFQFMKKKHVLTTTIITLCSLSSTILSGCSESNKDKAYQLLNAARIAMVQNQHMKAHELLDSMRTTYPKEVDCRREALQFADSLELHEAKYAFAKADSSLTFKRLELEEMKKKFVLEKDEKYQSIGYYVVPSQSGNKQHLNFFAEVGEDGSMQLVTIDKKRHYSYTTVSLSEDGGSMALLPPNATADDALIVEQCYQLAKLFAEVKMGEEEIKHQMVKIRFFEEKITRGK